LHDVTPTGVVELRFTGMCAGCNLKPLTIASVVFPALRTLECVSDVVAPGARISRAAQARMRAITRPSSSPIEQSTPDHTSTPSPNE
jgi:hypothetical protein